MAFGIPVEGIPLLAGAKTAGMGTSENARNRLSGYILLR